MNTKFNLALLIFLCATVLPGEVLRAQGKEETTVRVKQMTLEEEEDTLRTAGLGLSFGVLGANGFSYINLPPKGSGYQFGGIFILVEDYSYLKLSAAYLHGFGRTRLTAFYGLVGISYKQVREEKSEWDYLYPNYERKWVKKSSRLAIGAGLGVSVRKLILERVWWSLSVPLTYYKDTLLPWPVFSVYYLLW